MTLTMTEFNLIDGFRDFFEILTPSYSPEIFNFHANFIFSEYKEGPYFSHIIFYKLDSMAHSL